MGTAETKQRALGYFQKAVEIDPGFALGYAGLADSHMALGNFSIMPSKEAYQKAKVGAQKALEIDNTLAEAHLNLAAIKHLYEYDQASADGEFRRAIELNPNLADAHANYAVYLDHMLRCDDALAEAKTAKQLDPLDPWGNVNIGIAMIPANTISTEASRKLNRQIGSSGCVLMPHRRMLNATIEMQKSRIRKRLICLYRASTWRR